MYTRVNSSFTIWAKTWENWIFAYAKTKPQISCAGTGSVYVHSTNSDTLLLKRTKTMQKFLLITEKYSKNTRLKILSKNAAAFLSAYRKVQEKITWTGVLKVDFLCVWFMRQYSLTRTGDIIKKNLFDEPCSLAKPIPNCRAYVDFVLFLSSIIPVSKQWNLDQTPSDGELSSVWSNSALFGYVLKYDAIGYVRSYRDGDMIFRNSLVFIIFCYLFDNRFTLSFLWNHYSLIFKFWLFINGNQHQTPIYRSQNLLWSVFPYNGSMSVYMTVAATSN